MFKIIYLLYLASFLILFQLITSPQAFAAAPETEAEKVLVRAAKHSDFIRIVFTLSEESSKKTSLALTNEKLIKVVFPRPVLLASYQQNTERLVMKGEGFFEIIKGIKIMAGSHFCLVQIERFENYKVSRLNAPSRIVIDAYYGLETPSKPSFPPPESVLKKTFGSFTIDPGHGGYDKGIYDENNREKDITLNVAKDMAQILSATGKKAILTRRADQRLFIRERIVIANTHAHDFFLSIHISANDECIIYTYAGKEENPSMNIKNKLSENIASSLITTIKKEFTFNIRHEKLPLPILKNVSAPALLIELPHFNHFIYDKKNREILIKTIIKGLVAPITN